MLSISALHYHIQASKLFDYHFLLILALNLLDLVSGQFQVIGPDQPIQALVGEDAIFSCYVSPEMSIKEMEVNFFKDQSSSALLLLNDGKEMQNGQKQEYQGRTQLEQIAIAEGRVSLKLRNITLSDSGIYGCWFSSQTFHQTHTWELRVAALGSSPLISLEKYGDRGIMLICRSAGWFPRPEIQWINHQAQFVTSDFKANTGYKGLFDIEASLIVEEPFSGDISCSIHIWDLRKESRIRIAEEFFQLSSWIYAFGFMVAIFLILVASGLLLHTRQDWRIKMGKEGWRNATKHAVNVTLDPDTAHPILQISKDCKKVTYCDTKLDVHKTAKRFQSPSVVSTQGFSSGEYYWEVNVGKKNRWYLGVCLDEVDRGKKDPKLSPTNGYWVLGQWNQHEHFTFSPSRQNLILQVQPERVGIFLNCKYGQVSFYNVTDKTHIYTFTGYDFNGKILRAFFRPRSNDTDELSPPLVICTLSYMNCRKYIFPYKRGDRNKALMAE